MSTWSPKATIATTTATTTKSLDKDLLELIKFREEPAVDFVIKLMNLEFDIFDARRKWDQISDRVDFLSRRLIEEVYKISVRSSCLYFQDNMDLNTVNMANATLLDK